MVLEAAGVLELDRSRPVSAQLADEFRVVNGMALDITATLQRLARTRPVFHSEADLQHAFAWQLHLDHPEARVRIERRPDPAVREAADLSVIGPAGRPTAIEMKYLIRAADVTVDDERFILANQGAQDLGRYDVIKDLGRVERWVQVGLADRGLVVVLSNDPSHWRAPTRSTIDADFRLHEGRELSGKLAWASHAGARTTRGRTAAHVITGRYELHCQDFAELPNGHEIRALVLDTAVGVDQAPAAGHVDEGRGDRIAEHRN